MKKIKEQWHFRFILGIIVVITGAVLDYFLVIPKELLYFSGFVIASIFNLIIKEW